MTWRHVALWFAIGLLVAVSLTVAAWTVFSESSPWVMIPRLPRIG